MLGVICVDTIVIVQLRYDGDSSSVEILLDTCAKRFNIGRFQGLIGKDNVSLQSFFMERYGAHDIEKWEPFDFLPKRTSEEWVLMRLVIVPQ